MDRKECIQFLQEYLREKLDLKIWEIGQDEDHVLIKNLETPNLGFSLTISTVLSKLNKGEENKQIRESADKVIEMAKASLQSKSIRNHEDQIFPVFRSKSHPIEKQGQRFLFREHTPESMIFYALDLGKTYTLIDEDMLNKSGYSEDDIHRFALENVKKLETTYKTDEVAGNIFYFFSKADGYAASRLLNDELITFMRRKITDEMGIAIPHQDVLILADIRNETGFKILSRVNMDFCMRGDIPVSPLPFVWTEDGHMEPIMVMANPGAAPTVRKK